MTSEPRRTSPGGNPAAHLLVVDDDAGIRQLLQQYFGSQGYLVSSAADAASARRILAGTPIDLILLDVGLPDEDGFSLARYLREHWHGAVIIVSGRGDTIERVLGLEIGADDYVTKPFDLRELLARVRSVLRRTRAPAAADAGGPTGQLLFDALRLAPRARCLHDRHDCEIALTSGEFALLLALAENPNRVLSRDQLMQRLHGRDPGPYDRAIDVQISRLRQKIEPDPGRPTLIKSVRSAGYLFTPTVVRA